MAESAKDATNSTSGGPVPSGEKADDNHDVVGWDNAPQGKDVPWHPEPEADLAGVDRKNKRQWVLLLIWVVVLGVLVLGFSLPSLLQYDQSESHWSETAAALNLKALATAQAQYIKKMDVYASNAADLNSHGTLIAMDLRFGFDAWQNNGDNPTPSSKAGYVFRMLQGDAVPGPTSYYKTPGDPTAGMSTWAATARAAEPGTSGDHQFFITEEGTVYCHDEPKVGDPKYKAFLLDAVPNVRKIDGSLDENLLMAMGWRRTK